MKFRSRFFTVLFVAALLLIVGSQFVAQQAGAQIFAPTISNPNLAAVNSAFDSTLKYVIAGGYVLMFIGMVMEGPMITAAASFAAALGYFNIWAVFLLAILGDLAADVAYYAIGYFSRVAVIEKYGHRLGITQARMKKLEGLLKTHPKKTIVVLKLIPGLATPGLMMVGATRMNIARFASMCVGIILPKVLIFMFLGYYFGHAYDSISKYVQNGEYFIIFSIIFLVVAYYGYSKLTGIFARRLETI